MRDSVGSVVLVCLLMISAPLALAQEPPAECNDGFDNDGDGFTDYPDDPDCDFPEDPSEWPETGTFECNDGFDNDGDGLTDYPDDPDCDFAEDDSEFAQGGTFQCNDGIDNDGDGWTDFPNDPDCSFPEDDSEFPDGGTFECNDGIDNDGDGLTDFPEDDGCDFPEDDSEHSFGGTTECNDGIDNDGDGLTDFPDDPECVGPGHPSESSGGGNGTCPHSPTPSAADHGNSIARDPSTVAGGAYETIPSGGFPHAVRTDPLGSFPLDGAFSILTTGCVDFADDPNLSGSTGADIGGGNVRGDTDFDVTVLRIDLDVPAGMNCLGLSFQFLSEEFPEWVGTSYNDAFIAEIGASTWTTSGSSISAPDNFAFDVAGNVISINAAGAATMTADDAAGTTYDGATPVLEARSPVTPGAQALFLTIFDQGDAIYDSAVFLDDLYFFHSSDCKEGVVEPPEPELFANVTVADTWMVLEPATAEIHTGYDDGSPASNATLNLFMTYHSGNDTIDAVLALTSCAFWQTTATAGADGRASVPLPSAVLARCVPFLPVSLVETPTALLGGWFDVVVHATHGSAAATGATTYQVTVLPAWLGA